MTVGATLGGNLPVWATSGVSPSIFLGQSGETLLIYTAVTLGGREERNGNTVRTKRNGEKEVRVFLDGELKGRMGTSADRDGE